MINIKNKKDCCGCNACVQICPIHCISTITDEEGFSYPVVDNTVCINCNLCEKVCPVITQNIPRTPIVCYAAKNPNEDIRMKSSSGGVFSMLAERVINNNGVVFGACFNENWEVIHSYTETIDGITKFRGSKYVQSNIGNCYIKAKEFLNTGREVLFSGTPCQIAGLKRYLRKDYANLLTIDIICHGVPSPMVWHKYLSDINPDTLHLQEILFRDKSEGWKTFSFHAKAMQGGNTVTLTKSRLYLEVFLKNICLRPSCHQCPTRSGKGNSDITIADFWGIDVVDSEFDDDKGVSLILPYSTKGLEIINSLNLDKREKSINVDSKRNPNLHSDCKIPKCRTYFFKKLRKNNETLEQILHAVLKKESPSQLRLFAWRVKEKLKSIVK